MKIACPYFNALIEIHEGVPFALIIENQPLFRQFAEDIHSQLMGGEGDTVFSISNTPVAMSKYVDLLESFAPFDINSKTMLSGISAAIEKVAVDENHYIDTSRLIAETEKYISELGFSLPVTIECRKLNIGTIIKAASVAVADDFENVIEKIISYMSLILDLGGKKLFITLNMRSYFSDNEIELFIGEIKRKQLYVLMLENCARKKITGSDQLIIDSDLCEF